MKEYDVKLYKGWPETAGDTLEEMIEKGALEIVSQGEDGNYNLCAGIYSCHITGKDIYPTLKVFSIKEDRESFSVHALVHETVVKLQMRGNDFQGYQPTVVVPDAPEFFKRTQKDELLCIWPDEILNIYSDASVPEHHQCMKQEKLEETLRMLECSCLHCYTAGKSQHYGFAIPMAILSKETLSVSEWEPALKMLKDSRKVNVLYQSQIHGNEPAACDGALEVLKAFCEQEALQKLLDDVNVVVIPRMNPEAAYLYRRMAYDNIDLNRDHMACEAYETRLVHQIFRFLEPEVVLDGHEFTFFVAETEDGKGYVAKGCEIMSSPATSLNIAETVRNCSYAVCGRVFDDLKMKDYRINHFGTAEKGTLGRGFYGLNQCLSFLIETRGIGGGRYGYAKRVSAQKDIMLSYIKNVSVAAVEIKKTVEAARMQNVPDEIVLHHGSSGDGYTPYKGINEQYYLDGVLRCQTEEGLQLNDFPLRTRSLPKSYVMSADAEHIDEIIEKVEALGCYVRVAEPGTIMTVQGYRCIGLREEGAHEKDILAELLPEEEVAFNHGAVLFVAEDYRRILLALLLEPDLTDTVGTKGSLFQQGLMDYDEKTGRFPLNRTD